jgi:hypothetical protein
MSHRIGANRGFFWLLFFAAQRKVTTSCLQEKEDI